MKKTKERPYNRLHGAALRAGPNTPETYAWMLSLLRRIQKHWMLPHTELPHPDLFDEVERVRLLHRRRMIK